jgi:hypothetical protein
VITYSLHQGVKKFRSKAEEAAMKEMQQMVDQEYFDPIHRNELNDIEKQLMESLIFLSEKNVKPAPGQQQTQPNAELESQERQREMQASTCSQSEE